MEGNGPFTLEEVGKIVGLTRERVRQIETKVLKKLRNSPESRHLISYLYDGDENLSNREKNIFVDESGREVFLELPKNVPNSIVSYLLSCGLTIREIRAICSVTGIPSGYIKSVSQICTELNMTNYTLISSVKSACEKLSYTENGKDFINYINNLFMRNHNYYVTMIYEALIKKEKLKVKVKIL